MMMTSRSSTAVQEVYFSLSSNSPSLGANSGADIFYNAGPSGEGPESTYASHDQLGLVVDDDIDGLIVLDANTQGTFEAGDKVLFSLAAGSPSLATISGSTADVFVVDHGDAVSVFAYAADLGLAPSDELDALDYFVCKLGSGVACAARYGIRLHPIPAVTEWGLVVMALLGLVAGTILFRAKRRTEAS